MARFHPTRLPLRNWPWLFHVSIELHFWTQCKGPLWLSKLDIIITPPLPWFSNPSHPHAPLLSGVPDILPSPSTSLLMNSKKKKKSRMPFVSTHPSWLPSYISLTCKIGQEECLPHRIVVRIKLESPWSRAWNTVDLRSWGCCCSTPAG